MLSNRRASKSGGFTVLIDNQDSALGNLARETNTPRDVVMSVYKREVARLEVGARVRTFIPALALRRARAILRERRHHMLAA